jgi:hypothetical protein
VFLLVDILESLADALQQVSTLHKQNFDLKLELYHRRQRQEALEARLEAAEKQLVEQAELQEVNDQLLAELEKRDAAVNEAVCMIVSLEDKVERLMQEREHVRAFEADYEPGYFDSNHDDGPPSSPPQFESTHQSSVARMPSFLSETTEGADALRSLYLPNNHSYSDATLPKLLEEGTHDGMNSPRLSVLSESSFVSIYGEKHLALEEAEDTPRRHRASSSIEKWVDERPIPTNSPPRPSPPLRKSQFLSINDVLESPLQRLEKLKHTLAKANQRLENSSEQVVVPEKRQPKELRQLFTSEKSGFEHQNNLPPTPDTISTNTLRHYQNSNDTLAQDHKDGTFLNNTPTFSVPAATFNAYQSTLSVRPRSAGETVTSRRDGHGWDTPSQSHADTDTVSEESITTFASQRYSRPSRVMTPNLFSFSGGDWGKDVMYDHDLSFPPRTASEYSHLRRSMIEPVSNQTVTRYTPPAEENPQYRSPALHKTEQPTLPDRRSSLTATTKLRKSNPPTSAVQAVASSPVSTTKRSRMPSLRIFGRSDTSPSTVSPSTASPTTARPKTRVRSQTYFDGSSPQYEDDESARATPPPIQRNRGPVSSYRPSSAGHGASRRVSKLASSTNTEQQMQKRRGSVGVKNDPAREVEDDTVKGTGSRKWFGIGAGVVRTSSLRRT